MKRLKLAAFKAKNNQPPAHALQALLGQVLGNCHDSGSRVPPSPSKSKSGTAATSNAENGS